MKLQREKLLCESESALIRMLDVLERLPDCYLDELPVKTTQAICLDLNNGFTAFGALCSPRNAQILVENRKFYTACIDRDIRVKAYSDDHACDSPEFATFPPHCISGSGEELMADEVSMLQSYTVYKNSTNAFFADGIDPRMTHYIITGCCTDICVSQLALTIRAYYNQIDRSVQVIVPMALVETFDTPEHHGELSNVIALYGMLQNGIQVVNDILYK